MKIMKGLPSGAEGELRRGALSWYRHVARQKASDSTASTAGTQADQDDGAEDVALQQAGRGRVAQPRRCPAR